MLQINHIRKRYSDFQVLKDVSFSINGGEIVALLGNNGAGKTTIINCILKMVKPDSGEILFEKRNIFTLNNRKYFTYVSSLLESSINVYNQLSGMQNILYFAGLSNVSSKLARETASIYIEKFDLDSYIDKPVGTYSRGMQQKLALVISLISKPKLILLDEPTLGLDIKSKHSIISILRDISSEGISVLLTSHQMDVVEKLGCKMLLLNNGVIEEIKLRESSDKYTVTYFSGRQVLSETMNGTFNDIYNKYREYEIIEIKREKQDLESYLLESCR